MKWMSLFHIMVLLVGEPQSFFLITKGEHNTWFLVKAENTTNGLCWQESNLIQLKRSTGGVNRTGKKGMNGTKWSHWKQTLTPLHTTKVMCLSGRCLWVNWHQPSIETKSHDADGTEEGGRKIDATWIRFTAWPHTVAGRQPTRKQHVAS